MKKKIFYFSTLLITILCLFTCIALNDHIYNFNAENVVKNIKYLSSSSFEGRRSGSDENLLAGEIIKNKFKDLKLTPYKNTYIEEFITTCPVKTDETVYFKIFDDNGSEYLKYGEDYKEDMINFNANSFTFSNKDKINIFSTSIEVSNDEGTLLFYLSQNDDLSFRSSFMCELRFDLVIALSSKGYNKILDALKNGKTLTTYIPFKNEDKKLVNIQGIIEGSDQSLAPLVLTAHFDHLGSDSQNNIYYGALDNASGTSFLLELANTLSTFGKPKRSIIFVALNAEELGLKGSNFFAENNYFDIKNSKVINFDMIGAKDCPITFIQGVAFKGNSSNILNSLSNICSNDSIEYLVEYENSSDHARFNELGIDALTICHSDTSHIHTPTDTVDYIDTDAINTVYKVVNKEIKKDCYSAVTTFIYSRKSINLLLIILLALIIIGILNTKPFKKSSWFLELISAYPYANTPN